MDFACQKHSGKNTHNLMVMIFCIDDAVFFGGTVISQNGAATTVFPPKQHTHSSLPALQSLH